MHIFINSTPFEEVMEEQILVREWTIRDGVRTDMHTKTVTDFENYFIVVVDSMRKDRTNSKVAEVFPNVVRDVRFCSDELLRRIIDLGLDIMEEYKKGFCSMDDLEKVRNGYSWMDFFNVVCEEQISRIKEGIHVASAHGDTNVITLNY